MHIGLLGCGNMGGAILKSLAHSKEFNKNDLFAFDTRTDHLKSFTQSIGIQSCVSSIDLAKKCDVVILACKPKDMKSLCTEIAPWVNSNHLIVSIAAGIELKFYQEIFPHARIVRVMPNMPLLVNAGMTVYSLGKNATVEDKKLIEKIFNLTGKVFEVHEDLIGISSIAFSCMPGWNAYFMSAFIDACKKHGLTEDQAQLMTAQAFLGSGKYILETHTKPADLAKQVASPGGITQRGFEVFEDAHFKELIDQVVSEALKRTQEISQQNK